MISNRTKAIILPILVYCAIIFGMHVLHSGWFAILGYHIIITAALAFDRGFRNLYKLKKGWNRLFGLPSIILGTMGGIIIYFLWPYMGPEDKQLGDMMAGLGLYGWRWISFAIYYILLNPGLEELFWRDYYLKLTNKEFVSDAAFSLYHVFVLLIFVSWPWTVLAFVILTSAAFSWRFCVSKFNGLIIPFLAHLLADISIIITAQILADF